MREKNDNKFNKTSNINIVHLRFVLFGNYDNKEMNEKLERIKSQ